MRYAVITVTLDESEAPATAHEAARIALTCDDSPVTIVTRPHDHNGDSLTPDELIDLAIDGEADCLATLRRIVNA